jgi:hypothetical protein
MAHAVERSRAEPIAGAGQILYALRPDSRLVLARSGRTGALCMRLTPGNAQLEFRAVGGAVLDRSGASRTPVSDPEADAPARYRPRRGR